ncbi:hypothetical protein ACOME3_010689 [Neoechinorhynchus agilis]
MVLSRALVTPQIPQYFGTSPPLFHGRRVNASSGTPLCRYTRNQQSKVLGGSSWRCSERCGMTENGEIPRFSQCTYGSLDCEAPQLLKDVKRRLQVITGDPRSGQNLVIKYQHRRVERQHCEHSGDNRGRRIIMFISSSERVCYIQVLVIKKKRFDKLVGDYQFEG